jgi:hypothetical protein
VKLLALALLLSASDHERLAGAPRSLDVIGGAPDGDTHAVVAVELDGYVTCTGSLIAARAVLTAAHCSWFPGLSVRAAGREIAVVDVQRHQRAAPGSFAQDLAILELGEAVDDVEPLAIGSLPNEAEALRVVGFGRDEHGDRGERRSVLATPVEITAETIRFEGAHATACRGDSGGPALTLEEPEMIVAVASYGDPDCEAFAVFERVDVHADFVADVLATLEDDSPSGCRVGRGAGPGACLLAMMLALVVPARLPVRASPARSGASGRARA